MILALQAAQDVSGLPFDMTGLNKEGFIYDTEPALLPLSPLNC